MDREKRERETRLLKFPELQAYVNEKVWQYLFREHTTYTRVAELCEVSKSRFSELKVLDSSGRYVHTLSESVLNPLVRRGIVALHDIEQHLDTSDPKKLEWLERQRLHQEIDNLLAGGHTVAEIRGKILELTGEGK